MDEFTSKKWYVYLGNRHEGPFSVEDISSQVGEGKLTQQTYVWAEGMTDWQPMTDLKDFQPVFTSISRNSGIETTLTSPAEVTKSIDSTPLFKTPLDPVFSLGAEEESPIEKKATKPKKFQWSLVLLGLGVILSLILFRMGDFKSSLSPLSILQDTTAALQELSRPHLLSLSRYFPKLEGWFSPLPAIDQIAAADYEELKTAARANPSTELKFGLAASQGDTLPPVIYVASNLPDETTFKVYVVGNPHTLLNHLSFVSSVDIKLNHKLGQSSPLRFADGKPIPKGEYSLYLVPGDQQPDSARHLLNALPSLLEKNPADVPKNSKIVAIKKYFLGGKEDTAYRARLKDYHDKLKTRAEAEITDIKQFLVTLANQLEETSVEYGKLTKGTLTAKKRQEWQTFHKQWTGFENQLNGIFQKWTPETVREQYFYGSLFLLTSQVGVAIDRLHGYQNSLFAENLDPKTLEIQIGEASSSAQNLIQTLKAKIDQAEKLPTSPDGIPLREELDNPPGK